MCKPAKSSFLDGVPSFEVLYDESDFISDSESEVILDVLNPERYFIDDYGYYEYDCYKLTAMAPFSWQKSICTSCYDRLLKNRTCPRTPVRNIEYGYVEYDTDDSDSDDTELDEFNCAIKDSLIFYNRCNCNGCRHRRNHVNDCVTCGPTILTISNLTLNHKKYFIDEFLHISLTSQDKVNLEDSICFHPRL